MLLLALPRSLDVIETKPCHAVEDQACSKGAKPQRRKSVDRPLRRAASSAPVYRRWRGRPDIEIDAPFFHNAYIYAIRSEIPDRSLRPRTAGFDRQQSRSHCPGAIHPAAAVISTITSLRRRKGSVQGGL